MGLAISDGLEDNRSALQFRRIFDVLLIVSKLGEPNTNQVHKELQSDIGVKCCYRTVSRDLRLLRALGMIESKIVPRSRGCKYTHRSTVKIEFIE